MTTIITTDTYQLDIEASFPYYRTVSHFRYAPLGGKGETLTAKCASCVSSNALGTSQSQINVGKLTCGNALSKTYHTV